MMLLIDNYDSFSYNVYQLAGAVEPNLKVIRNDEMNVEEVRALHPDAIIISPGPGRPENAGICEEVIWKLGGEIPILGICLGHQAVCQVFGAHVTYAPDLMHGKQSRIILDTESPLFDGMERKIEVGRYHSLAAAPGTLPQDLKVTAMTDRGEVMAVEHCTKPIYGVQFHPESILTPEGSKIMKNFYRIAREYRRQKVQGNRKRENGKLMIQEAIVLLNQRQDIGYEMAKEVMNEIMSGEANDVQKAAYLTALGMKGETIEEITGSAEEMRNHASRMSHDMEVLEIVGTGGDGSNSFNISTTASIVIAAAGVPVAKHGNRAASSRSGAADVLESLGVRITITPKQSEEVLKKTGICFLFAQVYHGAMKFVGPVRKELGIRTIFNILGPLTNPANPNTQLMGVYDESLVETMAHVLSKLGVKRGMVVYGQDRLDEISVSAPTTVCEFDNGRFERYEITPEQFGFERYPKEAMTGGTPDENAAITREILCGAQGPRRNAVLMNAGASLYIAGKATSMEEGIRMAAEIIDSGKATKKLEEFIQASNVA